MDMTIDQQVALDEALVPHASRLRIGERNFRLRSDITSKESTFQLVYDVMGLTSFYNVFLVIADVPKIYMQEFWATATVHHHSICFNMDNKKRIVNLERRIQNIIEPEFRAIENIVTMADRTMEELLQAPTEGYGEAIVVPEILAKNIEIKTNLLQLV
nr:reverse transcriptase domain-containing protein [Tanacetum cinerariifolium]